MIVLCDCIPSYEDIRYRKKSNVRHDLEDLAYHFELLTLSHPQVCFFTKARWHRVCGPLQRLYCRPRVERL
jgi:hypothetical protein